MFVVTYVQQLTDDDEMPEKATKSMEAQASQLKKIAAKRLILVVLDDMWDAEHERPFSCIDPATASKLLVVRIASSQLSWLFSRF